MNAEQFFRTVEKMREAQKRCDQMRISQNLDAARRLEKEVDDEIARVNEILNPRQQLNLFE